MQKIVLALDVHNELKCRKKVMKLVSSATGIDSISLDVKEKKLTLIGSMDLIQVVKKLEKVYRVEVITVEPAKEPEKEKPNTKPEPEPEIVIRNVYYPRFYYVYEYDY